MYLQTPSHVCSIAQWSKKKTNEVGGVDFGIALNKLKIYYHIFIEIFQVAM